jgi:hypothetical protein
MKSRQMSSGRAKKRTKHEKHLTGRNYTLILSRATAPVSMSVCGVEVPA